MSRLPTPITVSGPPDNRRALRRRRAGEAALAWTFVSPAVLIIIGLSVVPIVWSLLLSFESQTCRGRRPDVHTCAGDPFGAAAARHQTSRSGARRFGRCVRSMLAGEKCGYAFFLY